MTENANQIEHALDLQPLEGPDNLSALAEARARAIAALQIHLDARERVVADLLARLADPERQANEAFAALQADVARLQNEVEAREAALAEARARALAADQQTNDLRQQVQRYEQTLRWAPYRFTARMLAIYSWLRRGGRGG